MFVAIVKKVVQFILDRRSPSGTINSKHLTARGESIEQIVIREIKEADIPNLAALHVQTWNDTYPFVKNPPTIALREWQWKEQFKDPSHTWFCFVAENAKGQLIGFARGRIHAENEIKGELNKLYLLRQYQRLGIGKKLFEKVVNRFLNMGVESMIVFSEIEIPARHFYKAMGGIPVSRNSGNFTWKNLKSHDAHARHGKQPDTN